ncbi:hypothetical protein BDL97_05G033800 [Sphagnum fallax]|nr:hypothetical protein BDL97_05G033800 [Sphagnum fallax]
MASKIRQESIQALPLVRELAFRESYRNEKALQLILEKEIRAVHPSANAPHGTLTPGPMKTRPPPMTMEGRRFMAKGASKMSAADEEKYQNDSPSSHDAAFQEARRRGSIFKDLLIRPAHLVALDEARRYSRSSLYGGSLNVGDSSSYPIENSHTGRASHTRHNSFIERRKSSTSFQPSDSKRKSSFSVAFNRTKTLTEKKGKGAAQIEVEERLQARRESKMDAMGTCSYVKVRHILTGRMGLIAEIYKKMQTKFLDIGFKVPPNHFAQLAQKHSECKSYKNGGDLGWIPRAKLGTAGPFQEVAFSTPVGSISAPFRSAQGYHILLIEGRKN